MKNFIKGKKGFFFTLTAIALSLVIIFSFKVYEGERLREKNDVIKTRIISVNDFIKDVDNDLQKGIQITTTRTLLGLQEYITEQGQFLTNFDGSFEEGFLNGTVEGSNIGLLDESTFTDWVTKIRQQADSIDIFINFSVQSISLTHSDPWTVNASVEINISTEDKKGTAKWERTKVLFASISVFDFEDPLYIVSTNGKVTNTIQQTPHQPFVNGNNVDNLVEHLNGSYYVESNYSPTYLMRMQGDLGASPLGIESLVNLETLETQGITTESKSAVDAVYFSPAIPPDHRINKTPSWFRLDDTRLDAVYGADSVKCELTDICVTS